MRTLSARILLGFAALTITFGVITATVVVNLREVENEVQVIGDGYFQLTLRMKDVAQSENDLMEYIDKRLQHEPGPKPARSTLRQLIDARDNQVKSVAWIFPKLADLFQTDPTGIAKLQWDVVSLRVDIAGNAAEYQAVLDNPPVHLTLPLDASQEAAQNAFATLHAAEVQIAKGKIPTLVQEFTQLTASRTARVQDNEHIVRFRTIYLGIIAVVLGLLITIWVVITLRPLRRLREGARRVAAGDYTNPIAETGPAEVLELAREFNAMGRAVQERELGLVRSERLAAVGKMAAMITHEVRNPLSSIGLNTELLLDELEGAPREAAARELCQAITKELDRLTATTDDILAFGTIPKPKLSPESINPMVSALAAFVREDLAAKKVKLAVNLCADDPIALVDSGQLRQCLLNLVRNATDAVVANGGGTVTIRTARDNRTRPGRIEIAVADDGVGIDPQFLPKLFDPFFSTKEGGSGLGLALTQQIVRDHGGDLRVASTVGRGTTFTVSVPSGG